MALKDGAGLVKKYAMVNIQKYQNVAIGETVQACEKAYIKLLGSNGITGAGSSETQKATGTIERIAQSVIDGNSHFYLVLTGKDLIFDVPVQDFLQVVTLKEGDRVTIEYMEGDPVCTVLALEQNQRYQDYNMDVKSDQKTDSIDIELKQQWCYNSSR